MKKNNKIPEYFTPNNGRTITIRYVLFNCSPEDLDYKQDILNYRTRKFAELTGTEWFSETCVGDNEDQGAIYLCHQDTDVVVKCAASIVAFLKKTANIRFLPDLKKKTIVDKR